MKEIDGSKQNVILINKADLLTSEQRSAWATYFEKENVKVIFWSALAEAIPLAADAKVTWGPFGLGFREPDCSFWLVCLAFFNAHLWDFGGFVWLFLPAPKCCESRRTCGKGVTGGFALLSSGLYVTH